MKLLKKLYQLLFPPPYRKGKLHKKYLEMWRIKK